MKIPSPSSEIKVAGAFAQATFFALFAVAAAGCAGAVAQAPFPARNDTVVPGDLLGPFDGRVTDAQSGKPVAGAIVYAAWGFEVGRGLTAPAGSAAATTDTDSDGRYIVPRLAKLPGGRARVVRFTLIIYKRGFVAWRSDRRFEDGSTRHDFSQSLNAVKLDPAPPTLSHIKHVLFAGGGAPIRRAMAGEIVQASLELGGAAPGEGGPAGPQLDASVLLSSEELKAVTGYAGEFTIDKLGDLPTTASYDSHHFRATGKPESFDLALRVWKLGTPEAADARWAQVSKTVPNAEQKKELGDQSLRGSDGKILAAAVLDRSRGLVIELTCGVDQCRDGDQAVALLRRVLGRADKLGHAEAAPAAAPAEKEKEKEEPVEDSPFRLKQPELRR
jgi:hypothetical protein